MSLLFEEISLSPKLELCRANQDQIRNQRPRLRRNTLFLGRKAGGGGFCNPYFIISSNSSAKQSRLIEDIC